MVLSKWRALFIGMAFIPVGTSLSANSSETVETKPAVDAEPLDASQFYYIGSVSKIEEKVNEYGVKYTEVTAVFVLFIPLGYGVRDIITRGEVIEIYETVFFRTLGDRFIWALTQ